MGHEGHKYLRRQKNKIDKEDSQKEQKHMEHIGHKRHKEHEGHDHSAMRHLHHMEYIKRRFIVLVLVIDTIFLLSSMVWTGSAVFWILPQRVYYLYACNIYLNVASYRQ
ncbi:MAG: hypothetical protein L3J42_00115 [Hydrogenimonas sp.]|nr:hypothetical protein [Hydrogenimonas sp.]